MADEDQKPIDQSYGLVQYVKSRFETAKDARINYEQQWLLSTANYRGRYTSQVNFSDPNQSRVFVKVTKTKVVAAYGQLTEVLFSTGDFPLTITASKKPTGAPEYAYFDKQEQPEVPEEMEPDPNDVMGNVIGYDGDGRNLPPGATGSDLNGSFWKEAYGKLKSALKIGKAPDPSSQIQIKPAERSAAEMQKVIHDQIQEANVQHSIKRALFETVMLGTGVLKGPLTTEREYPKWEYIEGKPIYVPIKAQMPDITYASIWNIYPDPNALRPEDASYIVERHKDSRSELRSLSRLPGFDRAAIARVLSSGKGNYVKQDFENELFDDHNAEAETHTFERLEFWGMVGRTELEDAGFDVSAIEDDLEEMQVNIHVVGDEIIRLTVNPFKPFRLPYLFVPYEINPYSIWGIGLPENMEDSQQIMNGTARMAIDNLKYAGNAMFEMDETALVAGQSLEVFPGKIFRRQSGQPGAAVLPIKVPAVTNENMQMFDRFRQIADDETGIPSYSHGTTGVMSTTRTAAGMSMLMSAAALNIKTVVKNVDDYLIEPLGKALFNWNMQFNANVPEILGDLAVEARGTAALMRKEVKSQRLMQFGQLGTNPQLAPLIKWPTYLKEVAEAMEMKPEDLIASPEEAMLYARIIGFQRAQMGAPVGPDGQPVMAPPGGMAEAGGGAMPSGAGAPTNIEAGPAPMPGENGYSASTPITTGKG